jgi:micrococcal nuclease
MWVNRTRNGLLVAVLLLGACARPPDGIGPSPAGARSPAQGTAAITGARAAPPAGTVRAVVAFWVDGDSVHVRDELLPSGRRTSPVRLIGIDAPEASPGEHAQRHVRRFNRSLDDIIALGRRSRAAAQNLAPPGTVIFLEHDVQERDPNRRALAYVWLRDGRMANEELVRAGWAMTLTIPPNVKYAERFTAAQREARGARAGIWSP